jgi:chemotaxis protein histidine kinase CheA
MEDASHPAFVRAYSIFVSELEAHIAAAKHLFEQAGEDQAAGLPDLRIAFHRIKGGAGFFGLDHIAGHAAELERLLLKPLAEACRNMDRIKAEVGELESSLRDLPPADPPVEGER